MLAERLGEGLPQDESPGFIARHRATHAEGVFSMGDFFALNLDGVIAGHVFRPNCLIEFARLKILGEETLRMGG